MMRIVKAFLAAFVAFFCLAYAAQNLVNLQQAYGFVAYVVGMTGHEIYPSHFGPGFTSPAILWSMLAIIIGLELLAGVLAARGALAMWAARKSSAGEFNQAKQFALLGCAVALFIWFGIFSAVGGAYFQMWQTEAGSAALQGAFQYAMLNGLIMLVLTHADD